MSTTTAKNTTRVNKRNLTKNLKQEQVASPQATQSVVEPQVVAPVSEPVVETPVVAESSESHEAASKKTRTRRVVNRDTLDEDFKHILEVIEKEIEKLRQNNEKVKGVKFLRTLNKSVKILRSDCSRILKIRQKNNRPRSTTSGFMKPVRISSEMSTFTGWAPDQLYSRVDVTKFICKYIRDNKLQNNEDRRQIVCDDKLKALLQYDPSGNSEPLTYFRLQQYIQRHFVKAEEDDSETVDVEEDEE